MQRSDFYYGLPEELIAQQPLADRTASRLLCLDRLSGSLCDHNFSDLPRLLSPGDLLVLNDTRVIPARLYGLKDSGGRVEILIERMLDDARALVQLKAGKSPKPGSTIRFGNDKSARVENRAGCFYVLRFSVPANEILDQFGHVPLPPYIRRADEPSDRERYQTVYARVPGAVAAPTAGLHFDGNLLDRLARHGIGSAFVTLHVGAGTFQPVRCEDVRAHRLHGEYAEVGLATCDAIAETRSRGGRIIAVGTTAVRSIESAARIGKLVPFKGETNLYILPGFEFRVVDAMITNFHLPESTLLMLVSAFAGRQRILAAYKHAVEGGYRFFSYGDAMLISTFGSDNS